MRVLAHLRVVAVGADTSSRPTAEQLRHAAEVLGALGFTVVRVGRRGVSVEGNERDFEQVLGVAHCDPAGMSEAVTPADARLAGVVDWVEVLPRPEVFGR